MNVVGEMRRSPRPSTGRAAHPDRAVLAASFAEDVVLDLQCSDDDSASASGTVVVTRRSDDGCVNGGSPRAAPRTNAPPIPKPRSGREGVI